LCCGKEGKKKAKAPNFQIEMRNPFLWLSRSIDETPFVPLTFEKKKKNKKPPNPKILGTQNSI